MLEDRACSGGRVKPMDLAKSERVRVMSVSRRCFVKAHVVKWALWGFRRVSIVGCQARGEMAKSLGAWEVAVPLAKPQTSIRRHDTKRGSLPPELESTSEHHQKHIEQSPRLQCIMSRLALR